MTYPLPSASSFSASSVSQAQFQTQFSALISYLGSLLGTSGTALDARTALGLGGVAVNYLDRGAWVTGTSYHANDLVATGGIVYACMSPHISGTFATDLVAGDWVVYQGLTLNQFIAMGLQVMPTLATLRATLPSSAQRALLMGLASDGDGGEGIFTWSAGSTATDDNATVINPTGNSGAGRWLRLAFNGEYNVQWFGVVGDGVTNDSVAFQNALNAANGSVLRVPSDLNCLISGVVMNGFNSTTVLVDGLLTLAPDGGTTTFGGAFVGLLIENCTGCTFDLSWSGNRANMTNVEHIYCVGVAGGSDLYFPNLEFSEIRGDGMYISQLSWTSNTAIPTRIRIDSISGKNSADDGRNLLTIISVQTLNIGDVQSYQIGGVVGGVHQPGGVDIEPNYGYQTCQNITIGSMNITSAGGTGFAITGQAVTSDSVRDWCCSHISIGNANVVMTATNGYPLFQRCKDVSVRLISNPTGNKQASGFDYADHVTATIVSAGCLNGLMVGYSNYVYDSVFTVDIRNYSSEGILSVGAERCTFYGRVYGATSSSSTFAIRTRALSRAGGVTQTAVKYMVDCPYDGQNARAFRNEVGDTVTYGAGTMACSCDWSGYANFPAQCDAAIPTMNILGRNIGMATTAPTSGAWATGDILWTATPAASTTPGWICTSGSTPTFKAMANLGA